MTGQVGQIMVNLADNIMVGRLGPVPLAAVSLSIAIFVMLFVVGMGISFALPPLVSEADGAEDHSGIPQYFKHSLIINLTYAVICVVLIELFIPYMHILGQDPEVVAMAQPYLVISAWSMIPMMLFQTFKGHSEGLSHTVQPMIAMLVGNVVNVIANYMLIFGEWGAPAMGVEGAAIGTLISRFVMVIVVVYLLYKNKKLWYHIKVANFKKYKRNLFRKVLSLGIPSSLQMFFEVSAFASASILMGMLSANAQAAHQISINLASTTFMICAGIGMASTIRVGNKLGERNDIGMKKAGISSILLVTMFMTFTGFFFFIFREQLPLIYMNNTEVVSIASILLIMAAIFQIPDGVQVVALGALRGLQDVKMPTIITFISYWLIGIPASYILAFKMDYGPLGVWIGLVLGLVVSAIWLTLRFIKRTNFA